MPTQPYQFSSSSLSVPYLYSAPCLPFVWYTLVVGSCLDASTFAALLHPQQSTTVHDSVRTDRSTTYFQHSQSAAYHCTRPRAVPPCVKPGWQGLVAQIVVTGELGLDFLPSQQ